MNRLKQLLLLLITILIILGTCGCMSVEQDYKEPIQNYLKEKYGCNFEVKQVTKEFNGYDGSYIRTVCTSEEYAGNFEVFCYPVEGRIGDKIMLDGGEYVIIDDYADIVFQNQLEEQLKEQIDEDVFVKCQITFSNYCITEPEYKSGMKACLEDQAHSSHVVVYIVTNNEDELERIQKMVETSCLEINAYMQYLYFAIAPSADVSDIQQHFEENPELFDQHIKECDQIERVQFTLIKRDEGITKRSVEKE